MFIDLFKFDSFHFVTPSEKFCVKAIKASRTMLVFFVGRYNKA